MRKTLEFDIRVKECAWKDGDQIDNGFDFRCPEEHILQGGGLDNVYFSFHKGRHAWGSSRILNELYPCIKNIVTKETIIVPEFGYIDSKVQLVKYKDPEEAVTRYIDGFLSTFPENKIRFLEPIPQFINNLGTGPDIYNFEDRYPMHKAFVANLRKQCNERGLDDPISPEKLFGVDKFDESYECHDCDYCLEPTSVGIKWDHLKKQYNKQLLDYILENINQS